jgi:hypothetical protein
LNRVYCIVFYWKGSSPEKLSQAKHFSFRNIVRVRPTRGETYSLNHSKLLGWKKERKKYNLDYKFNYIYIYIYIWWLKLIFYRQTFSLFSISFLLRTLLFPFLFLFLSLLFIQTILLCSSRMESKRFDDGPFRRKKACSKTLLYIKIRAF